MNDIHPVDYSHDEKQAADLMKRIRERRKAMRAYEESGSEPVLFPVMECSVCTDPLYACSRSPIYGVCDACLRQRVADAEAAKVGRSAMWTTLPIIAAIMGIAWLLGWAGSALFFWLGGLFA